MNGRTLVPLRFVVESLGAKVDWIEDGQKIIITDKSIKIEMQIDNPVATANGKSITLDQPPVILNGRTMVPVRFVSENCGAKVAWVEESSTVIVSRP